MCDRYTMTVDQRTIECRFGAKFISGHFEHYEPTYNAVPSTIRLASLSPSDTRSTSSRAPGTLGSD
jgi:hypothetical protein